MTVKKIFESLRKMNEASGLNWLSHNIGSYPSLTSIDNVTKEEKEILSKVEFRDNEVINYTDDSYLSNITLNDINEFLKINRLSNDVYSAIIVSGLRKPNIFVREYGKVYRLGGSTKSRQEDAVTEFEYTIDNGVIRTSTGEVYINLEQFEDLGNKDVDWKKISVEEFNKKYGGRDNE